jgi:DNA-binding MarR family transcriptional regulator
MTRRAGARPRRPAAREHAYQRLLLRELLHAFYWLDDGLQAHMRRAAGFSLPRAQSMIMVCIGDGIHRQSDIALTLRVSKQAVQQGVRELVAKDFVKIEPDPDSRRQKRVVFTTRGEAMRDVAADGLRRIEAELARRIGRTRLDGLRRALEADWGPSPQ